MNKLQKIDTISIIIIAGFSFAVFYHYILGTYLGLTYPYDTFLFRPDDKFMDFFNMLVSPYRDGKFHNVQFPFGQRLAQSFTIFPPNIGLAVFFTIFVSFFLCVNYSNLKISIKEQTIKNVFIFSFLTYPFLFVVDRANIEVFVFIFLYMFIHFYRTQKILLSIVFLSCAISMKLFPAVFVILLLSDRKYKEAVYTCFLVILISMLGYFSYDGNIVENIRAHMATLNWYSMVYSIGNEGLYFGNSLWGPVKLMIIGSGIKCTPALATKVYSISVMILFAIISVYIIFKEKIFWKKIALLVFSMNLFPFVSGDYKLIHIFLPLFLFINDENKNRFDWLYAVLFGLLMVPKAYVHYPLNPEITSSLIISPLLMVFFTIVIVFQGLSAGIGKCKTV
ncbi:MAG TPA: glycosyltransferase 87 family protein [Smithella sp.]|nr:glycosyltransferase 87 family protein [Smithella sp.]HNY51068.1 glycosyltransferase 87 family protein [Smithella sp.]HOG91170.1 glycosyltransferase 87 family protein [Smithella sp.]